MFPELPLLIAVGLLGGALAIDGTGCGQFMVSRPFVAATLGGWLAGAPVEGAAIGLVLEAFHLTVLPVGAARYPEGGPPALVVGAVLAPAGLTVPGMVTGIVFFLVWGWIGGESVRLLRQRNVGLVPASGSARATLAEVQRRHLLALAGDFVRGTILVTIGVALLAAMLVAARASWGIGELVPGLVVDASVAALLASCLRFFGGRGWLFGGGAAVGVLVLLFLP